MVTLNLPSDLGKIMCRELAVAGHREMGGILMGEQLAPARFKITDITYQHGGTFARFVRNAYSALAALKQFFNRTGQRYETFNYLGEWHSHPSFALIPSDTDHASMIDIVCDQNVGANFIVLLIVRLNESNDLECSVTVYLPDGTVSQGFIDIEPNTDD